ncbi:MAG: CoA pyrophosphatase [Betaproteobacteria bacterium]|nr:CoA pyrophosphatase [Betaproteobacteria bacterium]MDH5220516.1 CoA pyrophosphatase [Betaproteobacteria bacterium]MDH5351380.1 CoA pyrophosphatase [Betaproteobacteria bacterium]
MKPVPFDEALRARLAANLARLAPAPLAAGSLKRAAVCVVVTGEAGEAALLLTRRAQRLSAHPGQYALPGGRIDEGETPLDAARREAREEIGLEIAAEAFLGRLDDYPTRSGYLITPLVAWVAAGAEIVPNPAEVEQVYRVPLAELAREGSPQFIAIAESDRPVVRYPLLGSLIHAPTAAVLYQFMEVAVLGRDTRVAHLEQPVWAWR